MNFVISDGLFVTNFTRRCCRYLKVRLINSENKQTFARVHYYSRRVLNRFLNRRNGVGPSRDARRQRVIFRFGRTIPVDGSL